MLCVDCIDAGRHRKFPLDGRHLEPPLIEQACSRTRPGLLAPPGAGRWKIRTRLGRLRASRVVLYSDGRSRQVSKAAAFNYISASRSTCLLYTSDAADEEDSVDLGGR